MLATWIYDGILSDPGREFMVQQTNFKSVITDPLEMNCCLVAENIPSFLQDVSYVACPSLILKLFIIIVIDSIL